jgi:hypothetical protein
VAGELPDGLSRARACELLGVNRATAYRDMALPEAPEGDRWSDGDERLAVLVDREHVAHPAFGCVLSTSFERKSHRFLSSIRSGPAQPF